MTFPQIEHSGAWRVIFDMEFVFGIGLTCWETT
jgi:hypothetical protein